MPRIVITGASSGIGRAAAIELARASAAGGTPTRGSPRPPPQASLLLAARNVDALARVADECCAAGASDVRYQTADVTSLDEVRDLARTAGDSWDDGADVVIANAGIGQFGDFLDADPADVRRVVETDLLGVLWTAHAFGPLLAKARGHLIVVGSQAGRVATPRSSVYAASKWALTGWTRSVRPEMEARGIAVTLFAPGGVDTEFADRRLLSPGVGDEGRRRVPGSQSVEHVATKLVHAVRKRPAEVDLSLVGAVGRAASAVAPQTVARAVFKARRRG